MTAVVRGRAGAPYEPGLLALREGPLLEAAVRALPERPDVVLVDATGRDHPRRAGLALHLGAVLDLPTVGVTHRPLRAGGAWPIARAGARSALILDHEEVGAWLRVRTTARPLAVHAAWRTDPDTAAAVVLASTAGGRVRTPRPLRPRATPPASPARRTAAERMQGAMPPPEDRPAARVIADTRRICAMPAPPFAEGPRAELVAFLLGETGVAARIDETGNVIARPAARRAPTRSCSPPTSTPSSPRGRRSRSRRATAASPRPGSGTTRSRWPRCSTSRATCAAGR